MSATQPDLFAAADEPAPVPSSTMHATRTVTMPDGHVTVETYESVWRGFTAADAIRARALRLKNAGRSSYRIDGDVLHVHYEQGWGVEDYALRWTNGGAA